MFFWWICAGESGLPVLFLCHLSTALCIQVSKKASKVVWCAHLLKNFPQFFFLLLLLLLLLWSTVENFNIVNEAEVDIFPEFPCFLYDSMDADNVSSGFSAFSKSNLYIWNFLVHLLLKTSSKDFEHCITSMWNESNCTEIWTFFGTVLLWEWNENLSQSCGTAKFSKFAEILSVAL